MTTADKQKNPWAIAIGGRLQQARQMAGFDTMKQLLDRLPKQWRNKRSRFTNYEAGISLAPPDIIELISSVTHCSACWIMFESGPIRDDNRDLQAVRHQNLVFMLNRLKQLGQLSSFYKNTGLSKHKIDEYQNDPFRQIKDRFAQKFEKILKLNTGWMDEQHIENDPVCSSFPEDLRELMTLYSNADGEKRTMLMKIARVLVKQ